MSNTWSPPALTVKITTRTATWRSADGKWRLLVSTCRLRETVPTVSSFDFRASALGGHRRHEPRVDLCPDPLLERLYRVQAAHFLFLRHRVHHMPPGDRPGAWRIRR